MKMKVVVARYNEDVGWTSQFQNVIIYNKGAPLDGSFNEIPLANVGREGHTYYKYICDNYDNLEDHMVFLQGNPFDHSPNVIAKINGIKTTTTKFEFLSENILDCNLSGCPHHVGLPMADVYFKIFNMSLTDYAFRFGAGAQFVVSKEVIMSRPRSFYLKIVEMLEKSVNPIEGFVIERLHAIIFSDMPAFSDNI
jgi:hypothetical protein